MANTVPSDHIPNKMLAFVNRLVYCREEYKHALVMALLVSHNREAFTAVPYILATSDGPQSGKSTIAYDIPLLLAYNVESIDRQTTRDALNNMWLQRDKPNTAWDDISKIFGPNGTSGSLTNGYTLLVKSYKRNGKTAMSRNGATVKVGTYHMAFLNGLQNAVPFDLFTRCIHFKMDPAPERIAATLEDALDDGIAAYAEVLKESMHGWANSRTKQFELFMQTKVRRIHPALVSRRRQKWGPLFAAADAAGGEWPRRIFDAFVEIELDAEEKPKMLPEEFIVRDTAQILLRDDMNSVFTQDLVELLRDMPAGQYYRDVPLDDLVKLITDVFGSPSRITSTMRYGEHAGVSGRAQGYRAVPILKAAADLHEMYFPPMAEVVDPLEEAFAFEPLKRKEEVAA